MREMGGDLMAHEQVVIWDWVMQDDRAEGTLTLTLEARGKQGTDRTAGETSEGKTGLGAFEGSGKDTVAGGVQRGPRREQASRGERASGTGLRSTVLWPHGPRARRTGARLRAAGEGTGGRAGARHTAWGHGEGQGREESRTNRRFLA